MFLGSVVLLLFPTPVLCIVFQSIWKELSLNDPSLTNLTEISVRFTYNFLKQIKIQEVLSKDTIVFQNLYEACRFLYVIVEAELNSTGFRELINDKYNEIDLVLMECINPVMYPLSGSFKAPVVGICVFGVLTVHYNISGSSV